MALHIADQEVTDLMTLYAQQVRLNKTEALRHLLRGVVVIEYEGASRGGYAGEKGTGQRAPIDGRGGSRDAIGQTTMGSGSFKRKPATDTANPQDGRPSAVSGGGGRTVAKGTRGKGKSKVGLTGERNG